jgi:hypothetical protein
MAKITKLTFLAVVAVVVALTSVEKAARKDVLLAKEEETAPTDRDVNLLLHHGIDLSKKKCNNFFK